MILKNRQLNKHGFFLGIKAPEYNKMTEMKHLSHCYIPLASYIIPKELLPSRAPVRLYNQIKDTK